MTINRDSAPAGWSKMQSSAHEDTQSGFHNEYIEFHLWFVYIHEYRIPRTRVHQSNSI